MATLRAPPPTKPPEVGERPTGALVYDVDGLLRVYPLRRDLIRLGRGHRADISFSDDTVSRCHALVLIRPDGAVEVIDEASRSGTRVNGAPVERSPLNHGDVIGIGRTLLRYVVLAR